ncbi:MAG: hypothetical protein WCJ33_02600 [Pseudomonadota bacterium]
MNSAIDDAIEKIYIAFSQEAKPSSIEVCECCISEQEVKIMLETPLRNLTAQQLESYAGLVFLTSGSEEDFRYFTPRILDIGIQDKFSLCFEQIGKALARGNWLSWEEPLRASIINLFSVVWEIAIKSDDGWRLDTLICSFALTGLDLKPFLARLESKEFENALIGFYEQNSQQLLRGILRNPFWEDHKEEADPVIEWFGSPKVLEIINRHYGIS